MIVIVVECRFYRFKPGCYYTNLPFELKKSYSTTIIVKITIIMKILISKICFFLANDRPVFEPGSGIRIFFRLFSELYTKIEKNVIESILNSRTSQITFHVVVSLCCHLKSSDPFREYEFSSGKFEIYPCS